MSIPENISFWKKRYEIDCISLWLSLNAWMRDRYTTSKDRDMLEILKRGGSTLSDRFADLLRAKTSSGSRFRGNFDGLQRALANAEILYDWWPGKMVGLSCCIVDWNNGQPKFESVIKGENKH